MQIAGMVQDSIVDGPGLRFTLFTQGCPHHCPGCHNPGTHDPAAGETRSPAEIIEEMLKNPLTDGLTLSGGEPFLQPAACAQVARAARGAGLNVWAYSGWTFEALLAMPEAGELLSLLDVLVDGPFLEAQRSLDLPWRGSKNQRIIDVQKSLAAGAAVLWQAPAGPVF